MYGTVRTVVWEDGGGNALSYPMRPRISTGCSECSVEASVFPNRTVHLNGRQLPKGTDDNK